ncbi:MAG: WecB/TagA/CpsF family glycosyltransferase, partial [Pseudomonadota bacterium]
IVGAEHGYFTSEGEAAVLQRINDAAPDILLVAFGVPRQDEWLAKHMHQLDVGAAMGVGGLFDFYSGRIPRAPLWLRKLGLEWMFRLHQEPARLMRRYLIGNITFTLWAAMEALRCVWWARAKRMIDLTLAFAGLLILAPLFAIIALAIRLDSKGPIFFRQTRVGQNGKPFRMLKFRSMHIDAEQRRASLLASNERGSKTSFKMQNDPRITRVGRLLRRASLDELPQLLNIFQGSMSLVGPRPALPREVSYYESRALKRLNGKPGLTCTWQVSGRALIDFREQVEMDITYLERQGPLTDLLILLRTIPAVVSGRGAM